MFLKFFSLFGARASDFGEPKSVKFCKGLKPIVSLTDLQFTVLQQKIRRMHPIKGFLIIKIPFCTPRRQSAADAGGLAAGLAVGELAVRTTLSSRSVARDTSGRTCHEVERGGGRSGK